MHARASIIAASLLALSAPAFAQGAAASAAGAIDLRSGRVIRTADGKRLGEIERVTRDSSGTPRSASVIYNGRFVTIPADTLSASGSVYVTNLNVADVRKLP